MTAAPPVSAPVAISVACAIPAALPPITSSSTSCSSAHAASRTTIARPRAGRAGMRDEHAGDAEERHRKHVGRREPGDRRVALAEGGADQRGRIDRNDDHRGEPERAGDADRGGERAPLGRGPRQQHQWDGRGGERRQPAERREHGEAAGLVGPEQRARGDDVLVLDDREQQEGCDGDAGHAAGSGAPRCGGSRSQRAARPRARPSRRSRRRQRAPASPSTAPSATPAVSRMTGSASRLVAARRGAPMPYRRPRSRAIRPAVRRCGGEQQHHRERQMQQRATAGWTAIATVPPAISPAPRTRRRMRSASSGVSALPALRLAAGTWTSR